MWENRLLKWGLVTLGVLVVLAACGTKRDVARLYKIESWWGDSAEIAVEGVDCLGEARFFLVKTLEDWEIDLKKSGYFTSRKRFPVGEPFGFQFRQTELGGFFYEWGHAGEPTMKTLVGSGFVQFWGFYQSFAAKARRAAWHTMDEWWA